MHNTKKQPESKKLKLDRTKIASLTLTPRQMSAVFGGVYATETPPLPSNGIVGDPCTGRPTRPTTM
jgi:hypothetical protein